MPNDWVVIYNLEIGEKLEWLLTGKGSMFASLDASQQSRFELTSIQNGKFKNPIEMFISTKLVPDHVSDVFFIKNDQSVLVIERAFNIINDGKWVVEIDNLVSIRELYRLIGGRFRVESGPSSFECQADDIKILSKAISITEFIE